jgi:hypothetical protein
VGVSVVSMRVLGECNICILSSAGAGILGEWKGDAGAIIVGWGISRSPLPLYQIFSEVFSISAFKLQSPRGDYFRREPKVWGGDFSKWRFKAPSLGDPDVPV